MVQLLPVGAQTGFDIAQALTSSHLGIREAQKLIKRGKASGPVIATITTNVQIKLMPWQHLQQLSENSVTGIDRYLL